VDWVRNATTGHYYARDDQERPTRIYKITRQAYGKTGWTFTAYFRAFGKINEEFERIPLSFSSRLKDAKAYAEKHLKESK